MADGPNEDLPALQPEYIEPTGVAVVTAIHDNLVLNFLNDRNPSIEFPSLWRLAKHVVNERGPLIVYRYKDQT